MNVLEKILDEIEEMRDIMESTVARDCFGKDCEHDDCTVCVCEKVMEIIRSHMNDIPDDGWIPVEERFPENGEKIFYDMQLVTLEDGEVCLGVYRNQENEWWTRRQQGEEWYTNKHDVVAWQPIPEPYKKIKSTDN